jgi:hypothetical protein
MLMNPVFRSRDERGAVLVHAAILLVALTAFSALVFDLGVMFVSRRQAQNAADAGALAAATSLAFVDASSQALAQGSAIAAAQRNLVWGEAPGVSGTDVTFLPVSRCPPGSAGVGTCVRVNVFRTSFEGGGGTALPTFFASIVGVDEQGTRATATAQLAASSGTADCVKPWAIPDLWIDSAPLAPPVTFSSALDMYIAPTASSPGTGYQLPRDQGIPLTLSLGVPTDPALRNGYYPVMIGSSPPPYLSEIEGCSNVRVAPNDILTSDASGTAGLTVAGVTTLIGRDPTATWNPAANGGLGAPSGGCMADGSCSRSPRLVAVPLFDPAAYDAGLPGATILRVTNVAGLWLERVAGADVIGYLTPYPTVSLTGPVYTEASSFARTVVLVR